MKRYLAPLLILTTFLLLSSPPPAYAAGIAEINAATNVAYSTSFAFTATGCNFLWVGVLNDGGTDPVSAVTYAGASMTQLTKLQGDVATHWIYSYGLLNPTTGSNTISITSSNASLYLDAICYSGVNTTSMAAATDGSNTGSNNTASLSGTDYTQSLTPAHTGTWMVLYIRDTANTITAGTNSTQRTAQFTTIKSFDSNGTAMSVGSAFTMHVTATATNSIFSVKLLLAPTAAAVTATFNPYLFWDF